MPHPNKAAERASSYGRRNRIMTGPWGLQAGNVQGEGRESRMIPGVAVITKGEALGHGVWIDEVFLESAVAAGNASRGIKCRFTHPGLCADGLGKYMGRFRNFTRDGNRVRADLHFSDTTRKAPEFDQDPAEYIADLAEKDPEAFGTSIVFWPDRGEEDRFIAEHEDEDGAFVSPDPENTKNLIHARLAKLDGCDIVDDPAANPDGFFSRGEETAVLAEQTLSWLTRIEGARAPGPEVLGRAEPDRIREFFDGFMARHGLEVVALADLNHKEEIMPKTAQSCTLAEGDAPKYCVCNDCEYSEDHVAGAPCAEKTCPTCGNPLVGSDEKPESKPEPTPAPEEPATESRGHWKALKAAFPDDQVFAVECFDKGISLSDARAQYLGVIQARLAERDSEMQKLREENTSMRTRLLSGEDTPVPPSGDIKSDPAASFHTIVRAYQKEKEVSFEDAVKMCRLTHSKEFEAARTAGLI